MYFSNIQQQQKEDNFIDVNMMQDKLVKYINKNWYHELTTNILNFCNQEDLDFNCIKDIIPKPVLKELELVGVEKGILKRTKPSKKIVFH